MTVSEHDRHLLALAAYRRFWEPHTHTDPQVRPLWEGLHDRGLKVGVLSNTIWPRAFHESIFERDGVRHLIDGDVYTSEIPWTKPSPKAFGAAMDAVGALDYPVFVKPSRAGSSMGISRVSTPEALEAAIEFARAMKQSHPNLPLAFNYSSSFRWHKDPNPLTFRELGELGVPVWVSVGVWVGVLLGVFVNVLKFEGRRK